VDLAGQVRETLTTATGGLGVLTTDLDLPEVTQTTVHAHLLHALDILTELGGNLVRNEVQATAGLHVLVTVEEPVRDVEVTRVLDDGTDRLDLLLRQLTGALVDVNLGLLAHNVGETTANTGDLGQGNPDLLASVDIRVQNSENVCDEIKNHMREIQRNFERN